MTDGIHIVDPLADDPEEEPVDGVQAEDQAEAPTEAAVEPEEYVAPSIGGRPLPEKELTPEQRRIRELENQLALKLGREDPEPEYDEFHGGETVLIHFLEDGITANGRVWYRGQELEFEKGSRAYEDTKDRNGHSWLSLADDEMEQARKWGKVMFRRGPWPGNTYAEGSAQAAEAARNRKAPVLPAR